MVEKKKVENLAKDIKIFEEGTDKSLISLLMRSGMTKEEAIKYHEKSKNKAKAKGGMVNKYAKGGAVKKKKNKMLTTKGWGASRKT